MDRDTSKVIETISVATAVSVTTISIAYFVIAVWWSGLVDARHAEELAKHETCYQEWRFNEAHQTRWLMTAYCTQPTPPQGEGE